MPYSSAPAPGPLRPSTEGTRAPLEPLFLPASVAIVGVSRDPSKWGNRIARNLLEGGFAGKLFSINPRLSPGSEVPGTVIGGLSDAATEIDCVVIAVPVEGILDALRDCAQAGVKCVILPAAGFSETGGVGVARQEEISRIAGDTGMRILGPNCFGAYSAAGRANLSPYEALPAGNIAMISQSGNLALAVAHEFRRVGLGFESLVGLGNQVDISAGELLRRAATSECRAVAIYIEGIDKDRADGFIVGIEACREAGKSVAVMKGGRTRAGGETTRSHTASLAGNYRVWEAILDESGAISVTSVEQLADVMQCAAHLPRELGRRVMIITDGGGDSVVTVDSILTSDLTLAEPEEAVVAALDALAPPDAPRTAVMNPVTLDTKGGLEDDPLLLAKCTQAVVASKQIDVLAISGLLGGYTDRQSEEVQAVHALGQLTDHMPIVMQSVFALDDVPTIDAIRSAGIPLFTTSERMATALALYLQVKCRPEQVDTPDADPRLGSVRTRHSEPIPVGELLSILAASGVELPPSEIISDPSGATEAAKRVGGGRAVALKVADPKVIHKSDRGGVHLGLATPDDVRAAAADLASRFPGAPLLVMPMLPPGRELLVGCHQDETFGLCLTVGSGGIATEILNDVVVLAGRVTEDRVHDALRRLRMSPLLLGARGQPRPDLDSFTELCVRAWQTARSQGDLELEMNPVLLYQHSYGVADVRGSRIHDVRKGIGD